MEKIIMELDSLLDQIERRPEIFIGGREILHLKLFLDGYITCKPDKIATYHGIPFDEFGEFLSDKYSDLRTFSWAHFIDEYEQGDKIDAFFRLLREYCSKKENDLKWMNRIVSIKAGQVESIKERNKEKCIVEIDGKLCKTEQQYLDLMWEKLNFPHPDWIHSFNRYSDWDIDLTWMEQEAVILIIHHFHDFLIDDPSFKGWLMSDFIKGSLPYWKNKVKKYMVAGTPREFMLYLVE